MSGEPGPLVPQPTSSAEVEQLFVVYRRHVRDASVEGLSVDGCYCALFDAGLTLAKIVLRCEGLRISGSNMSRALLLDAVRGILDEEGSGLLAVLERGRRKRNRAVYDVAGTISRKEAETLGKTVADFELVVRGWLAVNHPGLLPPQLPLG